jgi:hypothetical protein
VTGPGGYETPALRPLGRLADMKTSQLIRLAASMLNETAPVAAQLRARAFMLERFAADLTQAGNCLEALRALGEVES